MQAEDAKAETWKTIGVFVELQIIESGWTITCKRCVCVWQVVYFMQKVAGDERGEVERSETWKSC